VAAGYTDGFFETGLSPWDIAAGALLVTEAGGLIGNFTGEADFLYQREVVAGNPKVYGQLVGLLSPFSRVISTEPAAAVESAPGASAEEAFAAGVSPSVEPVAAAPATAAKKPATRISKESMALEKQAAADAERKAPRARAPRGDDSPF
jgi:myo-inositol-1(or 4)-monophosphatase